MKIQTDLASIQPGDRVIVDFGGWRGDHQIRTVERLTATQIVCISGDRFRRDDGRRVGGGGWILTGDEAARAHATLHAHVARDRLTGALRDLRERAAKLDADAVDAITAAVRALGVS
jgi:hypothetical protein